MIPAPSTTCAVLAVLATTLPGQEGKPPAKAPQAQKEARISARHILIAWKGSPAATADTKLTKDEARKKAEELLAKLKGGGDFTALAKANSVCPSKAAGGYLGQFEKRRMVPQFSNAVSDAKVGEVVGPVETPFGFHLIERLEIEVPWPAKIGASHILVAYKGAERARETITRTKDEAQTLANKLYKEISAGKLDFAKAAKDNSDDKSSAMRGGELGTMDPGQMIPSFSDALVKLEIGKLSAPVETAFGFHIIRRDKLVLPLRASHILIPWKGASRAPAEVTRTKEDALKHANEILGRAQKGENFGGLAKLYSSCPSKQRGGDLGEFRKGQMVKGFEDATRNAKVGAIVGPIETMFGYHIIMRTQ